jgi:ribulose 1,5-bisphosphate synthetase/thiazole synthase
MCTVYASTLTGRVGASRSRDSMATGKKACDLVVLGSGAGGLTAALVASNSGMSCLVLEHSATVGGTRALQVLAEA